MAHYRKLRARGIPHETALKAAMRKHGLAKAGPTVTLNAPSGQAITVNANLLGTYRKLRRKGLKHSQALAIAKRAVATKPMSKAAATSRKCAVCGKRIPLDRRTCSPAHARMLLAGTRPLAKAGVPYAADHPPIVHHGKINWVDKVGGLPGPIDAIARALIAKGWDESVAVATAVATAKKSCATGTAFGGKVGIHAPARATICAAVAEWEMKKAAA